MVNGDDGFKLLMENVAKHARQVMAKAKAKLPEIKEALDDAEAELDKRIKDIERELGEL